MQFRNRYRCADGRWRTLEWSTRPTGDLLYCVARDVSQTAAEHRRVQLLEMAQEMSRTGYWYVDLYNECVEWSPEVYRIHGLDPATFTPTLASGIDAYHPDDRERVAGLVQKAIENKEPFEFELRLVRSDGEVRLVQSFGQPEANSQGEVTGIFGVFRDITDDQRVARERDLEQFAYMASHDLREPIRTISGFLELLDEEYLGEIDGSGREYVRHISAAADRMGQLVAGMLELTRSGQAFASRPVDLKAVVDEVLADLRSQVEETRAEVVVDVGHTVLGESFRLRQVFQNLVGNALKYCREGAGPRVSISSKRVAASVTICVEDNGLGINEQYFQRIFEPFQRLHARGEYSGSGIGLAIVERVVRGCGGRVWVESELGRGTRFFVQLPAAPAGGE